MLKHVLWSPLRALCVYTLHEKLGHGSLPYVNSEHLWFANPRMKRAPLSYTLWTARAMPTSSLVCGSSLPTRTAGCGQQQRGWASSCSSSKAVLLWPRPRMTLLQHWMGCCNWRASAQIYLPLSDIAAAHTQASSWAASGIWPGSWSSSRFVLCVYHHRARWARQFVCLPAACCILFVCVTNQGASRALAASEELVDLLKASVPTSCCL
jgi:hypothetical protein